MKLYIEDQSSVLIDEIIEGIFCDERADKKYWDGFSLLVNGKRSIKTKDGNWLSVIYNVLDLAECGKKISITFLDGKVIEIEFAMKYDFEKYPVVLYIHTYWIAGGLGSKAGSQRTTTYSLSIVGDRFVVGNLLETDQSGFSATGHSTDNFCSYLEDDPTIDEIQKILDEKKPGIKSLEFSVTKSRYFLYLEN